MISYKECCGITKDLKRKSEDEIKVDKKASWQSKPLFAYEFGQMTSCYRYCHVHAEYSCQRLALLLRNSSLVKHFHFLYSSLAHCTCVFFLASLVVARTITITQHPTAHNFYCSMLNGECFIL